MTPCATHIKTFVSDLDEQTRFYTGVFGKKPALLGAKSAVWITDNPRLCFEITADSGRSRQVPV
ncbi:MAG: hypothetical protein R3288_10740 [Woeseiaceae bacterium]|nr:hypothetical protein [Woeseiaceae bacterium]